MSNINVKAYNEAAKELKEEKQIVKKAFNEFFDVLFKEFKKNDDPFKVTIPYVGHIIRKKSKNGNKKSKED